MVKQQVLVSLVLTALLRRQDSNSVVRCHNNLMKKYFIPVEPHSITSLHVTAQERPLFKPHILWNDEQTKSVACHTVNLHKNPKVQRQECKFDDLV